MTVSVKFFANVKNVMGEEEIILDLDPSRQYSIKDILKEITRSGNKGSSTLTTDGKGTPLKSVRVVLNGKIIHSLNGDETTVQNGDRITIFPLLAGG